MPVKLEQADPSGFARMLSDILLDGLVINSGHGALIVGLIPAT